MGLGIPPLEIEILLESNPCEIQSLSTEIGRSQGSREPYLPGSQGAWEPGGAGSRAGWQRGRQSGSPGGGRKAARGPTPGGGSWDQQTSGWSSGLRSSQGLHEGLAAGFAASRPSVGKYDDLPDEVDMDDGRPSGPSHPPGRRGRLIDWPGPQGRRLAV